MLAAGAALGFLGFGVGLRPKHYPEILGHWPKVDWFEVITENFLVAGGRPRRVLEQVRAHYPLVLHGVSLSVGSADPLNFDYLRQVRDLARRIEPEWLSDHLCWTGVGGVNLHDLLPLPYTEESLRHVVTRIQQVQDFLGRQILLENVSSYLEFAHSTMSEAEFVAAVASQADCGILLDVNNLYVNAFNHGFDALEYLSALPAKRVRQIHLAGYADRGTFLHDTHDHPVWPAVWDLYREAIARFGAVATLIEWDAALPPLATVLAEAERARAIAQEVLGRGGRAQACAVVAQ
ncbi:MAG: DUF692 domain-containing protein [Candidatus Binatia bacterium]|nr:DUF692 domain-containing protein [Candidatus Binatia bacterium]